MHKKSHADKNVVIKVRYAIYCFHRKLYFAMFKNSHIVVVVVIGVVEA